MSHSAVTVIAVIRVRPGAEERARTLLHRIVTPTLQEPGCLAYELHQSATDPTEFMFHERWTSDEALAAHAASAAPHRLELREQLAELVDGRPSVSRWRAVQGRKKPRIFAIATGVARTCGVSRRRSTPSVSSSVSVSRRA
jgi:quinol monooxygenase YgiN